MTKGQEAVAVVLLALVILAVGPSPTAQAHASLQESTPRDGQVTAEPPGQVLLTFDEPVEDGLSAVRVFAADQSRVDRGTARSPLQDARQLSVALDGDLAQGSYLVDWRVVSRDSHLITGTFTFSVGRRGEVAAGVSDQSGAVDPWVLGALRLALLVAMVVTAGGSLFLLACWPAGLQQRRFGSVMAAAAVLGAWAALATVPLQAAHDAAGRLFPLPAWSTVQSFLLSTLGLATGVKFACFVLAGWLVRRRASPSQPVADVAVGSISWVLGGLAVAQIVAVACSGHAAGSPLWILVDATHLLAVTVWLGGLLLLTAALRADPPPHDLVQAVRRFSPVAALCVTVLVLTGLLQGARQVLEVRALAETDYGALLTAKVTLLVLMLAGALAARRALRQGTVDEADVAPQPAVARKVRVDRSGGSRRPPLSPQVQAISRSLRTEAAFGMLVLAVTAALVATPPARVAYRPSLRRDLVAGPVTVALSANPARSGKLSLHAYTTNADGTLDTSSTVELRATQAERGIKDLEIPLQSTEPGHYGSDTVDLPAAGTWTLEVVVTTRPNTSYTAATPLEVR